MDYQVGNIFMRPNPCKAGGVVDEHHHNFDHVTFFVKGKFRGKRWRELTAADSSKSWLLVSDRIFSAGQWCLIEKNVKHSFEALEDGELCCCYSHRDPQSHEVVQDYNGWDKAYE